MRLHVGFVAAVGDAVEEVVNAEELLKAASERRVGVVDIARRILGKNAESWRFFPGKAHRAVVVDFAGGEFFRGEGNAEVLIECVAGGRGPRKVPAHASFEGFDFGKRGARGGGEGDIALEEVRKHAVKA